MHFDTGDVVQLGRGNFVDPREFDARRLAGGVVAATMEFFARSPAA